jgi:CheY-like chemotaxis protein
MDDVHRILWVDDEPTQVMSKIQFLEDYGFEVATATSVAECKEKLSLQHYDLVIIDMMIPNTGDVDFIRAKGGLTTGLELARWIRKEHPDQKIVGCSISDEEAASVWFRMHASGFWLKGDLRPAHSLINRVQVALNGGLIEPTIFIVHGHNDVLTLQLKNYLQNVLLIGEPIILREQPTFGRALIEKFEDVADNSDLVFVLLTPDDCVYDPKTPVNPIRRARQNVIFELGYFYGKIGRRSGRIILLYQGILDIPSDKWY